MPPEPASELADTLIHLLDGDFVEITTADLSVTAEVIDHEREARDVGGVRQWRYTIRLMPVGEDAVELGPDRFRVTVESDAGDGWTVSELIAEVFVEDDLTYEFEPRGEITGVEVLRQP